jgi:quercetin dioxygenase-like cupin family protein
MTTHTGQPAPTVATALDPIDVEFLPWRLVLGRPGVRTKELWRSAEAVCALVQCEPGSSTAGPPHPFADHHIWVIEGLAILTGRRLAVGSYVHVPPDTPHPVMGGEHGCTLLQVHHRCEADTDRT